MAELFTSARTSHKSFGLLQSLIRERQTIQREQPALEKESEREREFISEKIQKDTFKETTSDCIIDILVALYSRTESLHYGKGL